MESNNVRELKDAFDASIIGNFVAVCIACHKIMLISYNDKGGQPYTIVHIKDDPFKDVFHCDCGFMIDRVACEGYDTVPLESLYRILANPMNRRILDEIYLNKNEFL